jgi:hypothetical protein
MNMAEQQKPWGDPKGQPPPPGTGGGVPGQPPKGDPHEPEDPSKKDKEQEKGGQHQR